MYKCINNSIGNVYHLEQFVSEFYPYSQKQLGFNQPATIRFESDEDNAGVMLGKTAYYDPATMEVALYVDGRHPKDVMRSLSHELVHHAQNCRGEFTAQDNTGAGYAQADPHLRKMEREAYTKGNLIFRDFEDLIKTGKIEVHIDFKNSGEPKMSLQEWKNNEINQKLMKKWGLLKESQNGEVHPWDVHFEPDDRSPEALKHFARDYLANRGRVPFEVIDYFKSIGLDGNHEALLSIAKTGVIPGEKLNEDSKEEESEHYGEDESADKHEEDRLEDHLDAIEHHLKRLRDDMGFDQHREDDHMDEGGMDCQETGVNETVSKKLSMKEAKELAHRLIERIRKEGK